MKNVLSIIAAAVLASCVNTAPAHAGAKYRLEIYENGPRWQTVMISIEFKRFSDCDKAQRAIWKRARMVVKTYDTKETANIVDAACVPNKGDF